jgi:hypothetical protein
MDKAARIRDNQRKSRERKREYIKSIEDELEAYKKEGLKVGMSSHCRVGWLEAHGSFSAMLNFRNQQELSMTRTGDSRKRMLL